MYTIVKFFCLYLILGGGGGGGGAGARSFSRLFIKRAGMYRDLSISEF